MNQTETTITLEATKVAGTTAEAGNKITEQIVDFTENIWTQQKEFVIIGGVIIIGLIWYMNKK